MFVLSCFRPIQRSSPKWSNVEFYLREKAPTTVSPVNKIAGSSASKTEKTVPRRNDISANARARSGLALLTINSAIQPPVKQTLAPTPEQNAPIKAKSGGGKANGSGDIREPIRATIITIVQVTNPAAPTIKLYGNRLNSHHFTISVNRVRSLGRLNSRHDRSFSRNWITQRPDALIGQASGLKIMAP
jgi:hypothetical protein